MKLIFLCFFAIFAIKAGICYSVEGPSSNSETYWGNFLAEVARNRATLRNIIENSSDPKQVRNAQTILQNIQEDCSIAPDLDETTFENRPRKIQNNRIGIIGCPSNKGQQKQGPELAPSAIRKAGLVDELRFNNEALDIKDYGDVQIINKQTNSPDYPRNMRNYGQVVGTAANIARKFGEVFNDGRIVVTLGGDHSVPIGSLGAHLNHNKDIVVIWVDAHSDINTNYTSTSANIHGMPVAILAKELEPYWPALPGLGWLRNKLPLKNLVYIGLRSVDPPERLILDKFNVHNYGMKEVDRYGIYGVIERALRDVDPENRKSIHVSYDIDSLDYLEAPSTGTRVRGGLSLREGISIMEEIYATGRLAAVDLVEVNPAIGSDEDAAKTVDAALQILKAAFGTVRKQGNTPFGTEIPRP